MIIYLSIFCSKKGFVPISRRWAQPPRYLWTSDTWYGYFYWVRL